MPKKIAKQCLLILLKALNKVPPSFKHKALKLLREIAAIVLTDKAFFELERRTRKLLKGSVIVGAGSNYKPKKKRVSWQPVRLPEGRSEETDIVICCAFLGREKQLDLAIAESQLSKRALVWILMGSDSGDESIILRLSDKYSNVFGALCGNFPVGAKWQACVDLANDLELDFELLCILGSDDIIAAKGFDYVVQRHEHNIKLREVSGFNSIPAIYCTNSWHIYNLCEGDFYYNSLFKCNYKLDATRQPLGAARFYAKSYLEEIDNFLFDCSLNKNLDNWGYENLVSRGKEVALFSDNEVPVMSIKIKLEMNSFGGILGSDNIETKEVVFHDRQKFFSNFEVDIKGFKL